MRQPEEEGASFAIVEGATRTREIVRSPSAKVGTMPYSAALPVLSLAFFVVRKNRRPEKVFEENISELDGLLERMWRDKRHLSLR
jgi:hypothetical protein